MRVQAGQVVWLEACPMRKLVLAAALLALAGCSEKNRQVDASRTAVGHRPERPQADLPSRPPSAPGGSYTRMGWDDDPRIDPSHSGFSPESDKGYIAARP